MGGLVPLEVADALSLFPAGTQRRRLKNIIQKITSHVRVLLLTGLVFSRETCYAQSEKTPMLGKTLEHLFESKPKIGALKFFLMNPGGEFTLEHAAKSAGVNRRKLYGELNKLMRVGLVGTRIARFEIEKPARRSRRNRKKFLKPKIKVLRKRVFFVNKDFDLYPELRALFSRVAPSGHDAMLSRIKRVGDMKLAILSGVFIKNDAAKADIVLVGDKLKKSRVNSFLRKLQAEVGKELNYAIMTTPEFRYRLDMNDRFVRDVLDFPHDKLINKLGI